MPAGSPHVICWPPIESGLGLLSAGRSAAGVARLYGGGWLLGGVGEDFVDKCGQWCKDRSRIRDFALQPGDRANATVFVALRVHRVRAHDE